MKCWKCGAEMPPGAAFCSACGSSQEQAAQPGQDAPQGQTPPPPSGGWAGGPAGGGGPNIVLTVFAAICAMVYGGLALRTLFYTVINILRVITAFYFPNLIFTAFDGLSGVLGLAMCALLVMTALRRTPQNSDGLLVCMGGVGAVMVALQLVNWLFLIIFYRYVSGYAGAFFKTLLGAAFTIAGVYLIERFLLGESPIQGKNADDLKADMQYTFGTLGQAASEAGARASEAAANAKAEREARAAQQAQYARQAQYTQEPGRAPGYAPFRLKADRSLIAYILLSLVTCGIYSWYFIYALARDVNVACAGDGKTTPGLVKLILLSLITCGFYSFYWYYSLGNRLAENAPRYGMTFSENGTTVLLWYVVGVLACGLGPLVGLHIIIKNTNSLCGAYNYQHGI